MKKKKLSIVWTCSDWVHHEHKTWWGAWLCGRWQRLTQRAGDAEKSLREKNQDAQEEYYYRRGGF